ncbi:MAG: chaperone modulatory protein CbpM [Azoarcus sp.]|nr:chaperone modulatory protein CbpM [Azoarcus sp.]
MTQNEIVTGVLVDEVTLTLEEAAQACGVEPQWIVERVEAGFLGDGSVQMTYWRFASHDLTRARRMRQLESAFDAVPELAALVVDLLEEVERLKRQVGSA